MSSTDSGNVALNPKPKPTEIENFGIGTIPAADRTSKPFDLFRIQFGGANTFATVLLGTFPILLGLSFWEAVGATILGLLVGTFFLMPMGLFGPKTGTNNAVSSGAHFGVRGRVAGSFLSLLCCQYKIFQCFYCFSFLLSDLFESAHWCVLYAFQLCLQLCFQLK